MARQASMRARWLRRAPDARSARDAGKPGSDAWLGLGGGGAGVRGPRLALGLALGLALDSALGLEQEPPTPPRCHPVRVPPNTSVRIRGGGGGGWGGPLPASALDRRAMSLARHAEQVIAAGHLARLGVRLGLGLGLGPELGPGLGLGLGLGWGSGWPQGRAQGGGSDRDERGTSPAPPRSA